MTDAAWNDTWAAVAKQLEESIRPALAAQAKILEVFGPTVELRQALAENISRTVSAALPMESMRDTWAKIAEQIEITPIHVPPQLIDATRFTSENFGPVQAAIRDVLERHEQIVGSLSFEAIEILQRDWDVLQDAAEVPVEEWTEETAGVALEAASSYARLVAVILWALLIGMVMSSRQAGVDPVIMKALDQLESAAQLVAVASGAIAAARRDAD